LQDEVPNQQHQVPCVNVIDEKMAHETNELAETPKLIENERSVEL
jgi:hypothetical protein